MPDREIFDGCSTKPWNVAYRAIFSDENDPNAVPRSVEALMPAIVGIESELEKLAETVADECAPTSLFQEFEYGRKDVLLRFPVELRDIFDHASTRTIRFLHPSAKPVPKDTILAHILSFAISRFVENSCAIVVATAELGKSGDWIQHRLGRLEADLMRSTEIRELARKVLRREVVASKPVRASRRKRTDMAELINVPISR